MRRRSVAPASPPGAGPARGGLKSAPVLRVGAALPDPPFEFMTGAGPSGFDIILMQRIAERIGRTWQLVPYEGSDFNGIFAGLESGAYDCIASGTTITPERERLADFCAPYAISGQSLVIDPGRHLSVHGIADLTGLVIGVQHRNASQPVAERLVAERRAARLRLYAYHEIEQALDELSTGGCDAFMKLAPVTAWFVRDRPKLKVVETGITRERLGICVRKGNTALRNAIDEAQAALMRDGTLPALIGEWLGAAAAPA
ncbi:MAG TPA: ABC transporter substrate-binding protein [Stellaceae bacterium]|nr:ABC transporter substrate-binding protein [Stellaceae bacterium]